MALKLILRKATLSDVEAITNIYLSSRRKFIAFAPLVHSDAAIYQWVYEALIPTNQLIIAEKDGIVVGMMALSKKENVGWIDQLYLSPEVVGQGIGTELVKMAKSILGPPICLHTFQESTEAKRFYEKNGFQIVGLTDGSKNEENCPDVLYEWR